MIWTDEGTVVFIGFSECFSCFVFWRFGFGAVLIIYSSAMFQRRIPIDVRDRFFSSVIPWVHCRDWCCSTWAWSFTMWLTAWLVSDVSDCAVLLLWFLLRIGFVERQETIPCAGALVWSFSLWCLRIQLDPRSRISCFYCLSVNLVVCAAPKATADRLCAAMRVLWQVAALARWQTLTIIESEGCKLSRKSRDSSLWVRKQGSVNQVKNCVLRPTWKDNTWYVQVANIGAYSSSRQSCHQQTHFQLFLIILNYSSRNN